MAPDLNAFDNSLNTPLHTGIRKLAVASSEACGFAYIHYDILKNMFYKEIEIILHRLQQHWLVQR